MSVQPSSAEELETAVKAWNRCFFDGVVNESTMISSPFFFVCRLNRSEVFITVL